MCLTGSPHYSGLSNIAGEKGLQITKVLCICNLPFPDTWISLPPCKRCTPSPVTPQKMETDWLPNISIVLVVLRNDYNWDHTARNCFGAICFGANLLSGCCLSDRHKESLTVLLQYHTCISNSSVRNIQTSCPKSEHMTRRGLWETCPIVVAIWLIWKTWREACPLEVLRKTELLHS